MVRVNVASWLVSRQKRIGEIVFSLFAVLLPAHQLWPLGGSFYIDWPNHEWAVGYFGAYFRANHTMPLVFNTNGLSGMAAPVFYGHLLYPLLGLFSSVLAPGVVLRIAAISVFYAQYRLISRAVIRIGAPSYFGQIVGCLVIWTTYPLTNLYNRAALTEFFATTLLVCALGALVLLTYAETARERRLFAAGAMFSLTIAAGTHPITAMYSGPVFVTLIPVFYWLLRHDKPRRTAVMRSLVPWTAAAVVCLVPWYLAAHKYAEDLLIRNSAREVTCLSVDTWTSRFYPIPHDHRLVPGVRLSDVNTPYLDVQASLSLILVFCLLGVLAAVALRRRALTPAVAFAIGCALLATFTVLSLYPSAYHVFPAIAVMIQYAYRAVTYINLSALLGILLTLMTLAAVPAFALDKRLRHPAMIALASCALLLAAAGQLVKSGHVAAVKEHKSSARLVLSAKQRRALLDLPRTYYGPFDYTTDKLFEAAVPPSRDNEVMPQNFVVDEDRFGLTKPIHLAFTQPTWVMTNTLVFPWTQLYLDGGAIPRADHKSHWGKITVQVPAGDHDLTMDFCPPTYWRVLRAIALLVMFAWCGFLLSYGVRSVWRTGVRLVRRDT